MLDIVRKYSKSPVAKAILLAVAASFFIGFSILTAVWRSCSIKGLHGNVARTGKWFITPRDFSMAYSRMLEVAREKEEFKNLDEKLLKEMVVQVLINSWLIANEAEKIGYRVSEDELNFEIRRALGIRGNIGKKDYLSLLASNRIFPEEFEKRLKMEILSSKLLSLLRDGIKISDEDLWIDYETENTKISVFLVKFDPSQMKVEVSEEKLKEYYESHKEEFKGGEKRIIRFALLSRGEGESKDLFSQRVSELKKEMLEKGFESVCMEKGITYSETPPFEKTGVFPVDLPSSDEIVNKAFSMKEGDVAEPVILDDKAIIFKLQGIITGEVLEFKDAIQDVKKKVMEIEGREKAKNKAEDFIQKIKDEKNPEKKARELGYKLEATEPFSLVDTEIKGIGQAKEIVISAWLLGESKRVSETPVFYNGAYYVLILKSLEKPKREDFEKRKDEIRTAYENQHLDIVQRELLVRMRSIYPVEIDRDLLEKKEE